MRIHRAERPDDLRPELPRLGVDIPETASNSHAYPCARRRINAREPRSRHAVSPRSPHTTRQKVIRQPLPYSREQSVFSIERTERFPGSSHSVARSRYNTSPIFRWCPRTVANPRSWKLSFRARIFKAFQSDEMMPQGLGGADVPPAVSHRTLVEVLACRLAVHHLDALVFVHDRLVGVSG